MKFCHYLLPLLLASSHALAQFPSERPASAPSARPKKPGEFQPGVQIDFKAQTVLVAGRVALNSGPAEFLACFPGKEHESLVLLEANPQHVYMALGLAGISPGKPQRWNEEHQAYEPADGDMVDALFRWRDGAGAEREAPAFDWLTEIEFGRPALDRPLVFAGSVRLESGHVAAESSGAGVAIVDMPDALLVPLSAHSSANSDLWALARTEKMPKPETPVTLVLRPAAVRNFRAELDARGDLRLNGRLTPLPEFLELLQSNRRIDKSFTCEMDCSKALRTDTFQLKKRLQQAKLQDAVTIQPSAATTSAPSR